MKISTGGIGTVATAQSCNAKSAFPYQWAWNFAGESVGDGIIVVGLETTITAVPTGIRWDFTGSSPYVDCYDEGAATSKVSGDLNAADKNAYYIHSLIDFSGSAALRDNLSSESGSSAPNLTDFELYWFNGGGTNYEGSDAIKEFKMSNGVTVLVHDLRNTNAEFGSDNYSGASGGDWVDRDTESPLRLENYFHGIAAVGQSLIHHGYILADRILSESDIGSLPVDISKARS